jgi:tagatose-6-phosphate ketose/aldose isomerase
LLISFARSGDSPESVKTVDLAENLSNKIYHLIITCNANGCLTKQTLRKSYVILLPEETNDRSLAMTSSFSSMLATILMIADLVSGISFSDKISIAADYIRNTLEKSTILLQEIAKLDFNRAIFLGSGPMLGIAREGHLKLQELTDGKVICKFDSFLGFRHGPRAVINDKSILIYLFSGDHYVSQYEKDLVTSIEKSRKGLLRIGIMENNIRTINISKKIVFSDKHRLEDAYLALCHVVPVQILGFLKSIESGLKPDNPSENGVISRVVEGVTVYPYNQVKNETASITKTGATT